MTSFQGHRAISLSLHWYNTSECCERFAYPACRRIWGCPFLGDTEDSDSSQKSSGLCEEVSKSHTDSSVVISFFLKSPLGKGKPSSMSISSGLWETSYGVGCYPSCVRELASLSPAKWLQLKEIIFFHYSAMRISRILGVLGYIPEFLGFSYKTIHILGYILLDMLSTLLFLLLVLHWLQARTGDLEIGAFRRCNYQTLRFYSLFHLSGFACIARHRHPKGVTGVSALLLLLLPNYSTHSIWLCSEVPPVISTLLLLLA